MKILCSIDMDDAWTASLDPYKNETYLAEAYENIFSIFDEIGALATLFIVGKDIDKSSRNLEKAVELGFELGNHSFNHQYNQDLSKEQKYLELTSCHEELQKFYPVIGYRAPGWGVDKDVNRMLSGLGYQYDSSHAIGYMFPLLKIIHWVYSRRKTHIYGRWQENISSQADLDVDIASVPLYSPIGIPFYFSIHYVLGWAVYSVIIELQLAKLGFENRNSVSYLFHARDFVGENFKKSSKVLKYFSRKAEILPIKEMFRF